MKAAGRWPFFFEDQSDLYGELIHDVDEARKLKPSIPLVGHYDIPIHDEIELEKVR